jgi:hypothetical protein
MADPSQGIPCTTPNPQVQQGKCIWKFDKVQNGYVLQACNCASGQKCYPPQGKVAGSDTVSTDCSP